MHNLIEYKDGSNLSGFEYRMGRQSGYGRRMGVWNRVLSSEINRKDNRMDWVYLVEIGKIIQPSGTRTQLRQSIPCQIRSPA